MRSVWSGGGGRGRREVGMFEDGEMAWLVKERCQKSLRRRLIRSRASKQFYEKAVLGKRLLWFRLVLQRHSLVAASWIIGKRSLWVNLVCKVVIKTSSDCNTEQSVLCIKPRFRFMSIGQGLKTVASVITVKNNSMIMLSFGFHGHVKLSNIRKGCNETEIDRSCRKESGTAGGKSYSSSVKEIITGLALFFERPKPST